MCLNLNIIIDNSLTFQRKEFALDSFEVTSFTEKAVSETKSTDILLRNPNGDVYVVARWEDEHLELIDFFMYMESVFIEGDELLEELIICFVAPVHSKYTDVPLICFLFRPYLRGSNDLLKWDFFVETISTDRYIHRTELWVVSLKSPSSVEYRTQKIFLNFVFFKELSRFKVWWIIDGFPLFFHTFRNFINFAKNWKNC